MAVYFVSTYGSQVERSALEVVLAKAADGTGCLMQGLAEAANTGYGVVSGRMEVQLWHFFFRILDAAHGHV
jgi:hypothetical protein